MLEICFRASMECSLVEALARQQEDVRPGEPAPKWRTAVHALQVQNVARHAFAELVERASACDRIRGVLALIKRHENLFRLPTRIRHATERGMYDQVVCQNCPSLPPLYCAEHALLQSPLYAMILSSIASHVQ